MVAEIDILLDQFKDLGSSINDLRTKVENIRDNLQSTRETLVEYATKSQHMEAQILNDRQSHKLLSDEVHLLQTKLDNKLDNVVVRGDKKFSEEFAAIKKKQDIYDSMESKILFLERTISKISEKDIKERYLNRIGNIIWAAVGAGVVMIISVLKNPSTIFKLF